MDSRCLILYILYFWGCSVYAVLAPFYPPIAFSKGMNEKSVGYLFSLYALIAFFMSPINGTIMNKIGRKNVLLIGGITESFRMLIFALVEDFTGDSFIIFSMIARVLMGAGGSALLVTCFAVISNLYPEDMESKIGIMETIGGVGLMAGPPVGGILFSIAGYKFVLITYTLLFLITTMISWRVLPDDNPEKIKNDKTISYWKLLSMKQIVLTLIVVVFGMAGPGFLEPVLAENLRLALNVSPFWIGAFFGFITLGYTFAMFFLGWFPKTFDRRHILLIGMMLEGVSFVLIGPWSLFGQPNAILTGIMLVILGVGSAWAYIPSLPYLIDTTLGEIPGADKELLSNTLSTMMGTTHYLGETLGPIVGGISCYFLGFQDGYALFGAIILGYAGIYWILNRKFGKNIGHENNINNNGVELEQMWQ